MVMRVYLFHQHVQHTVIILEEGNLPTPRVPPIRHDVALECTEQEAPFHCPVRQGGKKEAQMAGGGGAVGEFGEVLSSLRVTSGNSHLVQVSGTGSGGRGRRLASGGRQREEV